MQDTLLLKLRQVKLSVGLSENPPAFARATSRWLREAGVDLRVLWRILVARLLDRRRSLSRSLCAAAPCFVPEFFRPLVEVQTEAVVANVAAIMVLGITQSHVAPNAGRS